MRVRLMCVFVGILAAAAGSSMTGAAAPQTATAAKTAATGDHAAMTHDEMIKLALSAGPSDITARAAVVDMTMDGKTTQLRAGTNGWVCMAHPEVMCIDKEWQAFFDAYMQKKTPTIKTIGIGYMLRGDGGASNTDPFATKMTPDNQWVVSPPHVMILTPDTRQLDALPTDFRSGGPWVMWKGTKYAHIMVPTTPMASMAATK
jgi:hypothetical protein